MGVAGCGKSSLGAALAAALALPLIEGDDHHSAESRAKMSRGIALDDADRAGWLDRIGERLAQARDTGAVVTCSALRRLYRDRLRSASPGLRLVHLHGDPALLAERIGQRTGHYMPPTLLPSQLRTLEPPDPDEGATTLDIALPPERLVRLALQALR